MPSRRYFKYAAQVAAHVIASAIQTPIDAGAPSVACRDLLKAISLACENLGLPATPTHDSRGLVKVGFPLFGSTMEIVSTGLTLGLWFTECGRRLFREVDLTYDVANDKMVGPNGTDAAAAVATKLFNIAAEIAEMNVGAAHLTASRDPKASV